VGVSVGVSVGVDEGRSAITVGLGVDDDTRVGATVGVIGMPGCKLQASIPIARLIVATASARRSRRIFRYSYFSNHSIQQKSGNLLKCTKGRDLTIDGSPPQSQRERVYLSMYWKFRWVSCSRKSDARVRPLASHYSQLAIYWLSVLASESFSRFVATARRSTYRQCGSHLSRFS